MRTSVFIKDWWKMTIIYKGFWLYSTTLKIDIRKTIFTKKSMCVWTENTNNTGKKYPGKNVYINQNEVEDRNMK